MKVAGVIFGALVFGTIAALFAAAVAANYRGPYRDEDDLSDTRPRRPAR